MNCTDLIKLVVIAATQYITKYSNDYPKTIDSVYYINVEDLVKEQLLTNNLIESSSLELNSCVKVSVIDNKYEYDVEVTCTK